MTRHETYLSASAGKWRLIYQGMPLCADGSRERAESVAAHYKLALPAEYWDGDAGRMVPDTGRARA